MTVDLGVLVEPNADIPAISVKYQPADLRRFPGYVPAVQLNTVRRHWKNILKREPDVLGCTPKRAFGHE